MKSFSLSKIVGAGALSLSMAVVPLMMPASAQTSNGTTTSTSPSTTSTTTTETVKQDRGFDWGWLGLIGLAGLAGLARKRKNLSVFEIRQRNRPYWLLRIIFSVLFDRINILKGYRPNVTCL
jgi:hypothetical protein